MTLSQWALVIVPLVLWTWGAYTLGHARGWDRGIEWMRDQLRDGWGED